MHLPFRRGLPILFLLAAIFIAGCEPEATPTRRPTATRKPTATPEPTETPTLEPTATPTPIKATPRAVAVLVPKAAGVDPALPVFGPFPPIPIPPRPANMNPLTGVPANPAMLQRRPLLVRIGNDEKARTSLWQAGLNSADMVFEELIDQLGGAYANTRYTAVFLSNDPVLVGPVRSGRIVNLQLAPMLDGALSHAGASNGTRWLFSQTPMVNLDEYFNMPAYCYIKSHGYQGRLYTTASRLHQWMAQRGWEKSVPLYGFDFSDAAPSGQPVKAIGITNPPWPKWSQAEWRYDPGSNAYLRFVTGSPHIDHAYPVTAKWGNGADCVQTGAETQTQVRADNVVVLYARHEKTNIIEDTNNATSVLILLVGQGDAQFFRDGQMVRGKWQRRSEQEFFEFLDGSGQRFSLKPGSTWFEIVPIGYPLDLK